MTIDERLDGLAGEIIGEWERVAPLYWAAWNLRTFRENRESIRLEMIDSGADPRLVDKILNEDERRLRAELRDAKEER